MYFARKTALIFAGATAIIGPVVLGVADAPPMRAQVSRPTPANGRPGFDAFEVAAMKPTPPDWRGGRFIRMTSAHEFVARNHALRTLVAAAYNVNPQAISGGPPWVESAHYDIIAKSPGEVRPNATEQMAMLRNLLADRFKLTLGHAKKNLPYYAIVEARNGPKLKESRSEDEPPEGFPPLTFVVSPELIRLPGHHASVADLASVLQRAALDRSVVDETGLAGQFDFTLEFAPDETVFGGAFKPANSDDLARSGLFAAMQEQLGLKLKGAKGPVDVLVIEHVARPSEN